MKVRIPVKTQIEQLALQARLDALGIKVDPQGNVDVKSLEGLRAGKLRGLAALESVLDAGFLTHEATAKLTRAGFLGFSTASISEKDTSAVKSVIMNLEGVNHALEQGQSLPFFKVQGDEVTVDRAALNSAVKRIGQTLDNWDKTIGKRGLAHVAPETIVQLRETFVETMIATTFLAKNMSETRTALLAARSKTSGVAGFVAKPLLDSVLGSIEVLDNLNKIARWAVLSAPTPMSLYENTAQELASGVFSRNGVKELTQLFEKLDDETNLDLNTLVKGFKNLIDKNFISIRESAAFDLTVTTLEVLTESWPKNLERMDEEAKKGDLYAAIGAQRDATPGELQRSYRLAAKMYHPDANGERMSPEAFDRAKKAFDQLKDPAKRAAYDKQNPLAGESFRFRSLLQDPTRLMQELVRSDARAAVLKTETGLFELFSSIARANPDDPKQFLKALDQALVAKAGEPASFSPVDLDKLAETNGVVRGDYSPQNIGRALRTAFESLGPKETQGLVTRTFARAQGLIEPKGAVDEVIYAHDEKFVNTLRDFKDRLGFSVKGLNSDEQRYALGNFFYRLEEGTLPERPALPAQTPAT